jgi:hypothetical protein
VRVSPTRAASCVPFRTGPNNELYSKNVGVLNKILGSGADILQNQACRVGVYPGINFSLAHHVDGPPLNVHIANLFRGGLRRRRLSCGRPHISGVVKSVWEPFYQVRRQDFLERRLAPIDIYRLRLVGPTRQRWRLG